MQTKSLAAVSGQHWIVGGWELFRRNWPLWLAMSAVYLLIAALLQVIPFIGYLIMVLLTPLVISGVALTAQQEPRAQTASAQTSGERLKALFAEAGNKLFQGFFHPERTLAVMVVATFALGAVVLLQIVAQLLKVGGAALPAMAAGGVSASIWVPALISLVVVWALKLALISIVVFAVYGLVLRAQTPLAAMEHSLKCCLQHPLPVAALAAVFLVPIALLAYVHALAAYAVAAIALPLYGASMYVAFEEIFSYRAR